jgi:hypothetical protein
MPNERSPRAPAYAERLRANLVRYTRDRVRIYDSVTWTGAAAPG